MLAIAPDRSSMSTMLQSRPVEGNTLSTLFQNYAGKLATLKRVEKEIDDFAQTLVLQNMGASAKFFSPCYQPVSAAEIAIRPAKEVQVALSEGFEHQVAALRKKVIRTFDDLVEQKQVGLIQWFSPKVARFSYYTATYEDGAKKVRIDWNTKITQTERTHIHLMHIHDIIEARQVQLPAIEVPMPKRVREIIKRFPKHLQPFGRVVVGQEVSSQTVEVNRAKEIITETERIEPVFRHDPALTLGPYVLAGWANGEE